MGEGNNENISSDELNYEETINFIERKFKQSTDEIVNNFRYKMLIIVMI